MRCGRCHTFALRPWLSVYTKDGGEQLSYWCPMCRHSISVWGAAGGAGVRGISAGRVTQRRRWCWAHLAEEWVGCSLLPKILCNTLQRWVQEEKGPDGFLKQPKET